MKTTSSNSSVFTANVHQIEKAPKRISLMGDKTRKPEPAQHIIEFPGGSIEVSRTTSGDYWAHILVTRKLGNSGAKLEGQNGHTGPIGHIIDSRIGLSPFGEEGCAVIDVPSQERVEQIALLISTRDPRNPA